jgi:hypothetical protein
MPLLILSCRCFYDSTLESQHRAQLYRLPRLDRCTPDLSSHRVLRQLGPTLWRIYQGVALGIPQQREEEDQQAREKKETMDRYVVRNGNGNGNGANV